VKFVIRKPAVPAPAARPARDGAPGAKKQTALDRADNRGHAYEPPRAEASILDAMTDGRRVLERVCADRGWTWGIVRQTWTCQGGAVPDRVRVQVIIGPALAADGGSVDEALAALAEELAGAQV
jgi:hypothetical protein